MKQGSVAIIIPAMNEATRIEPVIKGAKKYGTVIVVNDGSSDNTGEIAQKAGANVLTHKINLGKGNAVKTGCDYAYQQGYELMVLMDADGQHLPEDIPRFLRALKGKDIVFGNREYSSDAPLMMNLGNQFFTWFSGLLFKLPIKDTQGGFRAFTRKSYRQIRWDAAGYAMESEMIFRAQGLRYTEIPIKRIYFDHAKGTTVLHGIPIALAMIRWKLFGG